MLQRLTDWFTYSLLPLDSQDAFAQAANYFIYDSIKIMLLLFAMISIIGIIRTYVPMSKVKKLLSKKSYGLSNLGSSLFGAVTPFCSCSSIPIFISFIRAGVPLGAAFSFLITSPLVNEYLVVLMLGFFGIKITAAYILFGIIAGVLGGLVLGRMGLEKHLDRDMTYEESQALEKKFDTFGSRLRFGLSEGKDIVKKLWIWVLVGVFAGALMHNVVPDELVHSIIERGGIFTVPIAVLIGVPIYGSCAAIIPIAVALFEKGVPLGTALAFMMAISALSFPEAVILRRAMNLKLILIFFGVVAGGIIVIGYLINLLQPILV